MAEYRAIYKCRLCGGTYHSPTYTAEHEDIALAMCHMEMGITTGSQFERHLVIPHNCGGPYAGSMGLADFQGWKKEE